MNASAHDTALSEADSPIIPCVDRDKQPRALRFNAGASGCPVDDEVVKPTETLPSGCGWRRE
jgi:hypothetical protein